MGIEPIWVGLNHAAGLMSLAAPVSELGLGSALLKMVLALLIVCTLAYLSLRFGLKRFIQRGQDGRCLRIIDHCVLGAGRGLWLVRAGERVLLLGDGDRGVTLLAEMPPTEIASQDKLSEKRSSPPVTLGTK